MIKRATTFISDRTIALVHKRQLLLVAMLVTLHVAMLLDIESTAARIWLLPHFALFLLWQPFVNARMTIPPVQLLLTVTVLLAAAYWMNWELAGLWLTLLAGMVGGRVFFFSDRRTRLFYLVALTYLILMLMLHVVPGSVIRAEVSPLLTQALIKIGGPILIGAMALLPESREREVANEAIDLVYSVFLMLLLAVLTLGSVSLMLLRQIDYIQALLITIFGMASMLLLASWLWNPVASFSGLGAVTSRYMLSIGLPFEQWIRSLADLAQRETNPARFMDEACQDMTRQLPWVKGCAWEDQSSRSASAASTDSQEIRASDSPSGVKNIFRQGELVLTLTTQQAMSPALVWHFNLVAQLVSRFYVEKKRERQLRELAYMQAVHETGARVTHDVKNLLQSLNGLLFVIGEPLPDAAERRSDKSQQLLRRQLPLITQRLQQTLDKLRVPDDGDNDLIAGTEWWHELQSRYASQRIRFECQGDLRRFIPAALFTNAAENFLQNAFDKRAGESAIDITVSLDMTVAQAQLTVTDTGSALVTGKAMDVGQRPLASENGLGIGLYQLSRLAALSNYAIALTSNRQGEVSFSLRPKFSA